MTPHLVANCGTTGKYSVVVYRRPSTPAEGHPGSNMLAVTVVQGAATSEAYAFEDNGAEAPRHARMAGLAVLAALQQYGA